MNVKVKMNNSALRKISIAQVKALEMTAEAIKTDVISKNVMPFDSGTMQNESTAIEVRLLQSGKVTVSSDTPYARKLYFHPEYRFNKDNNPNAKGRWYDDWIDGKFKNFAPNAYKKLFKKLSGV